MYIHGTGELVGASETFFSLLKSSVMLLPYPCCKTLCSICFRKSIILNYEKKFYIIDFLIKHISLRKILGSPIFSVDVS